MHQRRGSSLMREALSNILCSRYHRLYVMRHDVPPRSFRPFGFEPRDGWFGLIDALSFVLASRVAERDLGFSIIQVKEKLGTLRYYADGMDDYCRGAKWFAEEMSCRLSERSGHPGLPSRIGHYMCTLAPGGDPVASRFPSFRKSDEWRKRILQAAWSLRKDSRRLA
jgi:hypothetical protein